ncbi:spore coat protein GerQ [Aquibacillus sp. 3ASR75-11]|uniref:Spore coat protein GerQ n=1 Tax=Terrihalobacillus insolitus TaxID=2950438 RepID=A0A9X3WTA7_9BACI|nr:spore coat protein GerQ [Terrihalobacillus insolitus]MDC3414599.1 spore coat protein GerQ [Terrihalobacillus insolitus]MDC3425085.1 spore coat protein GerQ [Terrihalobacillus insolitus]
MSNERKKSEGNPQASGGNPYTSAVPGFDAAGAQGFDAAGAPGYGAAGVPGYGAGAVPSYGAAGVPGYGGANAPEYAFPGYDFGGYGQSPYYYPQTPTPGFQQGNFQGYPYPAGPTGSVPSVPDAPGLLPAEQSYIENILRLNRGKQATVYMTFENNDRWNAKVFKGIVEAAGRDHIILSDPESGKRYLLLMVYLDYVTFDEELNYEYPYANANNQQMAAYPPR